MRRLAQQKQRVYFSKAKLAFEVPTKLLAKKCYVLQGTAQALGHCLCEYVNRRAPSGTCFCSHVPELQAHGRTKKQKLVRVYLLSVVLHSFVFSSSSSFFFFFSVAALAMMCLSVIALVQPT